MKSLNGTKVKASARKCLDPLTKRQRSERMTLIRSKDTQPELVLRKLVFSLGYRYRLHDRRLPGRPDRVLPSRRSVIFMHGCFWHLHSCGTYRQPTSRAWFWSQKLTGNVMRDAEVRTWLAREGWGSLVVWECELRADPVKLAWKLIRFLQ